MFGRKHIARRRLGLRTGRRELGDSAGAIEDLRTAQPIAPSNTAVLARLTELLAEKDKDEALALLNPRIEESGDNLSELLAAKATVLARTGDEQGALATIHKAIADKPNNGSLLNNRCWLRGTINLQHDAALMDCTRAVEMSNKNSVAALDSRAMVYFRQSRLDAELADQLEK